jgi:hypothetical protein
MKLSEEEFRDLVRRMREAQKLYFATKTKTNMEAAMVLERLVDEQLGLRNSEERNQLKLF